MPGPSNMRAIKGVNSYKFAYSSGSETVRHDDLIGLFNFLRGFYDYSILCQ